MIISIQNLVLIGQFVFEILKKAELCRNDRETERETKNDRQGKSSIAPFSKIKRENDGQGKSSILSIAQKVGL